MFHFRQLQYFVVVAETLHVGRAAELLHITQPPLSRQIALLEKSLGVTLFKRHPKGVSLTPAGQQFYDDAKRILRTAEQASVNAKLVSEGKLGALNIGFMMHAAFNIVPGITRKFMRDFPKVSLRLQEVLPSLLVNSVQKGEFDGAIMLKPSVPVGMVALDICSEKLCLAVHIAHPLSQEPRVTAAMLSAFPFIATPFNVAPALREAIEGYCRSADFVPEVVLETQLQQTIVTLVAEDLGVALVPEPIQKLQHENVKFIPLANAPEVDYAMIWRSDNENPALKAFVDIAKSMCT